MCVQYDFFCLSTQYHYIVHTIQWFKHEFYTQFSRKCFEILQVYFRIIQVFCVPLYLMRWIFLTFTESPDDDEVVSTVTFPLGQLEIHTTTCSPHGDKHTLTDYTHEFHFCIYYYIAMLHARRL